MQSSRIVVNFVLAVVATIAGYSVSLGQPVLMKLELKTANDYTEAVSLGVAACYRFDDFVIAEFERSKLGELDEFGLKYQIIDEHPWTETYFLVMSCEGLEEADLEAFGKIILKDSKWYIIKTSPEKASELRGRRYKVVPIHQEALPLKYKPASRFPKPSAEYSSIIDSLLTLISADSLYTWDLRLQNFQTRYSYSDSIIRARDWLYNQYLSFGIDSVWLQGFDDGSYSGWNVVATVPGAVNPDKVIVVGAHYDSIVMGSGTDPFIWAPGADDNGSGTVATLEMARIVAAHPLPISVIFVSFDAEEIGAGGSYGFAGFLYGHGTNVQLMINSDMIGHNIAPDSAVAISGLANEMVYINLMMDMANTYTSLYPMYTGPYGSDEIAFVQFYYDAVAAHEPNYLWAGWHTNYDVIDSINLSYMTEVVKMCMGTLIYVGNSPSPVENLRVRNGGDGHTVYLDWSANPVAENIDHYHVYFGTLSGSYDSTHQVTGTVDTIYGLAENTTYYVAVAAVNSNAFESIEKREVSVTTYHFILDQGILLVDETYDQTLPYNFVNGDSTNEFYGRALHGYSYTYLDRNCPTCYPQNQLHVSDLLHYSPVIVHSEDNRGNHSLGDSNDSTYLVLEEYMNSGGKLIIEGRRNLSAGNDGEWAILQFDPGSIPFDYLKVKSAGVPYWSPGVRSEEFIGAQSQGWGYPDLQVDSLRVAQCSGGLDLVGRVPGVGYIDSLLAGEVIYKFNSAYDTSGSKGKPVAYRYLGTDYKLIYFDFPLYFIRETEACSLLHRALSDLETYPSSVEEEAISHLPLSFFLGQNFPNPFNPTCVIAYALPMDCQVRLVIYNLLGQKVKVLVDEHQDAGYKSLTWDGKDSQGQELATGIYFYRIEAGNFVQSKKMLLMK